MTRRRTGATFVFAESGIVAIVPSGSRSVSWPAVDFMIRPWSRIIVCHFPLISTFRSSCDHTPTIVGNGGGGVAPLPLPGEPAATPAPETTSVAIKIARNLRMVYT